MISLAFAGTRPRAASAVFALALALAAGACTPAQVGQTLNLAATTVKSVAATLIADAKAIDTAAIRDVGTACAALGTLDSDFKAFAAGAAQLGTPVPGAVITQEAVYMGAALPTCSNPAALASPATALPAIVAQIAAIKALVASATK